MLMRLHHPYLLGTIISYSGIAILVYGFYIMSEGSYIRYSNIYNYYCKKRYKDNYVGKFFYTKIFN